MSEKAQPPVEEAPQVTLSATETEPLSATASSPDQPEPSPEESHIGSNAFANEIFNLIGHEDVADITLLQSDIIERLHISNLSLHEFNDYASAKFSELSQEFQKHTTMITEMRKDLDWIFRKIRSIKMKIGEKYPEALAAADLGLEEEDEY